MLDVLKKITTENAWDEFASAFAMITSLEMQAESYLKEFDEVGERAKLLLCGLMGFSSTRVWVKLNPTRDRNFASVKH